MSHALPALLTQLRCHHCGNVPAYPLAPLPTFPSCCYPLVKLCWANPTIHLLLACWIGWEKHIIMPASSTLNPWSYTSVGSWWSPVITLPYLIYPKTHSFSDFSISEAGMQFTVNVNPGHQGSCCVIRIWLHTWGYGSHSNSNSFSFQSRNPSRITWRKTMNLSSVWKPSVNIFWLKSTSVKLWERVSVLTFSSPPL